MTPCRPCAMRARSPRYQIYGLNLAYCFDGSASRRRPATSTTRTTAISKSAPSKASARCSMRRPSPGVACVFDDRRFVELVGGRVVSKCRGFPVRRHSRHLLRMTPSTPTNPNRWPIYGEVGRKFADERFELRGGLRYFHDDVSLEETDRLTGITGQPINVVEHLRENDTARSAVVVSELAAHALRFLLTRIPQRLRTERRRRRRRARTRQRSNPTC